MFMSLFRAIAQAAAGVWLGGMILIAIVAQTTFGVMRTTGVDRPNAVAGQVMARNFLRFDRVQLVCVCVLVAWQAAALILRPPAARDVVRSLLIVAAAGLFLYSSQTLTPRILDLQPVMAAADPDAAMTERFDEFHETAVRIAQVNLVLVLFITIEMALPRRGALAAQAIGTRT